MCTARLGRFLPYPHLILYLFRVFYVFVLLSVCVNSVMTGLSKRIHDVSFKDRGCASPSLHNFFPHTPGGTGMSQYSSLNGEFFTITGDHIK